MLGTVAVLVLGVLGAVLDDAARPGAGMLGGPVVLDKRGAPDTAPTRNAPTGGPVTAAAVLADHSVDPAAAGAPAPVPASAAVAPVPLVSATRTTSTAAGTCTTTAAPVSAALTWGTAYFQPRTVSSRTARSGDRDPTTTVRDGRATVHGPRSPRGR